MRYIVGEDQNVRRRHEVKRLKMIGIIIMALLVAGSGAWVAIPALAKHPQQEAAMLPVVADEAPGNPAPGQMRRRGNVSVSGNVKTITVDAAGNIQTIVLSSLRGREITFQTGENTQYRFALGITRAAVGNFVTILGRRVPNANPMARMVIVNSVQSVFFLRGKVTAKGADSFTVKFADKEYILKVDANTKYKIVTPPARQPGQKRGQRTPPTITNGAFTDVKVDLRVGVRATGSPENLLATNITVFQPPPKPAPTPTPTPGATPTAKGASLRQTD